MSLTEHYDFVCKISEFVDEVIHSILSNGEEKNSDYLWAVMKFGQLSQMIQDEMIFVNQKVDDSYSDSITNDVVK